MEDEIESDRRTRVLQKKKEYREKNKEEIARKNKEYREKNKEKLYAKRNEWRLNNLERNKQNHAKWRAENVESVKIHRRKSKLKKYNLTLDDFNLLMQQQNGCCAVCLVKAEDTKNKWLCVDHNHLTGEVRGLLCDFCNTAIGLLREDLGIMQRASEYLKKFSEPLTPEPS